MQSQRGEEEGCGQASAQAEEQGRAAEEHERGREEERRTPMLRGEEGRVSETAEEKQEEEEGRASVLAGAFFAWAHAPGVVR